MSTAAIDETAPARERLLAVATRLFIDNGYEGTPVSRIVREAGVTMPVLYYHFGSKRELLGAVFTARTSWYRTELKCDPTASFETNCRTFVQQAVDHLDEVADGLRLRVQLGFETGHEVEKLRDLVREQRNRSRESIAQAMALALPDATTLRAAWLAEVFLSGIQALALELLGANRRGLFLPDKAANLVRTLGSVAALPEDELPDMGI